MLSRKSTNTDYIQDSGLFRVRFKHVLLYFICNIEHLIMLASNVEYPGLDLQSRSSQTKDYVICIC